jgi:hypothetical protein
MRATLERALKARYCAGREPIPGTKRASPSRPWRWRPVCWPPGTARSSAIASRCAVRRSPRCSPSWRRTLPGARSAMPMPTCARAKKPRVFEQPVTLEGATLRQLSILDPGHEETTILLRNDRKSTPAKLIARYAQRMHGYADAQARHIFHDLIDNPADVGVSERDVHVHFQRRARLPIIIAQSHRAIIANASMAQSLRRVGTRVRVRALPAAIPASRRNRLIVPACRNTHLFATTALRARWRCNDSSDAVDAVQTSVWMETPNVRQFGQAVRRPQRCTGCPSHPFRRPSHPSKVLRPC